MTSIHLPGRFRFIQTPRHTTTLNACRWFSCIFLLFANLQVKAQHTIFLSEGKIEFEKKINLYAQLDDDNTWTDFAKKTMPNFKTTYFNLLFTRNKTLYKPGREGSERSNNFWEQPVAEENVVFTDLEKQKSSTQKKLFDQLFLVQDSLRTIRWKITNETRTIAGFTCRRANAIIMDSIYVVAFYTEEILTTGGPESFTGLPGMILGVALPHQHLTWFATKVQTVSVAENEIIAPLKGKKVNNQSLKQTLDESLKEWGKNGKRYIQFMML
ncbi:GLPGLI family protein [Flavitalea flava]